MPLVDPPLTPPPKLKLSRLRDIGWTIWDPIGFLGADSKWDDDDCRNFADEYDSYLVQAAGRLRRGEEHERVAEYLVQIESEHMGLGIGPSAWERARKVVAAIDLDDELWTFPD